MKNEPTQTGWIETVVKTFTVDRIKINWQVISHWIDFHEKNPLLNSKHRSRCNRCKVKWIDMDDREGYINLAIVQGVGNRVVCCKCATELVAEKF